MNWKSMAAVAILAASSGIIATSFSVENDISRFLPEPGAEQTSKDMRRLMSSDLAQTLTLVIREKSDEAAILASQRVAAALKKRSDIRRVENGPIEGFADSMYEIYFPARYSMLYPAPARSWKRNLWDARILDARSQIETSMSHGLAALLPHDPLLGFTSIMSRLEKMNSSLRVIDGTFLLSEASTAVLFVHTETSPFDGGAQKELLAELDGLNLDILYSGVHPFAADAEFRIKRDIQRIAFFSMAALFMLLLLVFRRVSVVFWMAIPIVGGFVCALAVSLLIFDSVQGITLAFGAALMGICVDYPIHTLTHIRSPTEFPRIRTGLWLGCGTTLTATLVLCFTGLPAIIELAVFSSVGIIAALALTETLALPLLPLLNPSQETTTKLSESIDGAFQKKSRVPLWFLFFVLFACAGAALQATWADSFSQLIHRPAELVTEDLQVRALLSRPNTERLLFVRAPSVEQGLHELEGELGQNVDASSVLDFVWSGQRQNENRAAMEKSLPSDEEYRDILTRAGFKADLFDSTEDLIADGTNTLSLETLLRSPLAPFLSSLYWQEGDEHVFVALLGDGPSLPGEVDREKWLRNAYKESIGRSLPAIGVGLMLAFLLLIFRYRRFGDAARIALPPVCALVAVGAILAFLQIPISVLHLVGALLVFCIGLDYGIFVREHPTARTLVGIGVAACSTLFTFGVLALSSNPALSAFGSVVALGITTTLLGTWILRPHPKKEKS